MFRSMTQSLQFNVSAMSMNPEGGVEDAKKLHRDIAPKSATYKRCNCFFLGRGFDYLIYRPPCSHDLQRRNVVRRCRLSMELGVSFSRRVPQVPNEMF